MCGFVCALGVQVVMRWAQGPNNSTVQPGCGAIGWQARAPEGSSCCHDDTPGSLSPGAHTHTHTDTLVPLPGCLLTCAFFSFCLQSDEWIRSRPVQRLGPPRSCSCSCTARQAQCGPRRPGSAAGRAGDEQQRSCRCPCRLPGTGCWHGDEQHQQDEL